MGCGKSAAADDLDRYKTLCRKHGLDSKVTGPYSYDTEHGEFVEDLERGLSTVESVKNSRLRRIVRKEREITVKQEDQARLDRELAKLRSEVAELAKEVL